MAETATLTAPTTLEETSSAQLTPNITIDAKTGIATSKAPKANWFARVRAVRSHPTVKIARMLSVSPALNAEWTVETDEGAPSEAQDLIYNMFAPQRNHIVKSALFSMVDFGFAPFEKIWHTDPRTGALGVKKLKQMLVDTTKILIDPATGKYRGLYQEYKTPTGSTAKLSLETIYTLCTSQNVEGTNWYGKGDIEDVEPYYTKWQITEANVAQYETKFSGAHWVITYPIGRSRLGGVDTENSEIARQLLASLRSNGGVTIPRTLRSHVGNGDLTGNKIVTDQDWTITLIEPQSTAMAAMESRQRYLDTMMLRAMVMPERALTEGQHGTKAEAEAHADAALTYSEDRHKSLVQAINWHCVDQIMEFNFGPESVGTVRLVSEPVGAEEKLFFRDIYKAILSNANGFALVADQIDTASIMKMLKIPELADERLSVVKDALDEGADDSSVE